jgi:MoxR-like ATPase
MQELNQAEDIKQLTEKVKEQNVYFSLLKKEINQSNYRTRIHGR